MCVHDAPSSYSNNIQQRRWYILLLIVYLLCDLFYNDKILSIIVEGGAKTLNNFIENGIWDEMRVFKSKTNLGQGVNGPEINLIPEKTKNIDDDILEFYINKDFTFSNI